MEQNHTPQPEHAYDPEAVKDVAKYRSSVESIMADPDLSSEEKDALIIPKAQKLNEKLEGYSELQQTFAMWALSSEDEWGDIHWDNSASVQ